MNTGRETSSTVPTNTRFPTTLPRKIAVGVAGVSRTPSIARFSRSSTKARLRPSMPAKVNVTQSAPGARSRSPTAVLSRAK